MVEVEKQIGNLDLLRKIRKGLSIPGAVPDHVERLVKVVYFANPAVDPLNVENILRITKLRGGMVASGNTVGGFSVVFTVPTGYKIRIKKIQVIASNGSTNIDLHRLEIDGITVWDPQTNCPATYYRLLPSNGVTLLGSNAAASEFNETTADRRMTEEAWATREVRVVGTNGADNYYLLYVHYERYPLDVDETSTTDE